MLSEMSEPKQVLSLGSWVVSLFPHPSSWGIGLHWNLQCCRFWFLLGPFEVTQHWTDSTWELYWGPTDVEEGS